YFFTASMDRAAGGSVRNILIAAATHPRRYVYKEAGQRRKVGTVPSQLPNNGIFYAPRARDSPRQYSLSGRISTN
ncbi:MAG: hypothetical protein AAB320_03485, partial [Elusimicrobiota bacterium]